MPNNPIGISFLPSQEQAMDGPRRGQLEGVPEQAFKILSLRLPRVLGARAIAPPGLLQGQGSAGVSNPHAAVFEALLRAMTGQGVSTAPRMPRTMNPTAPGTEWRTAPPMQPSDPPMPKIGVGQQPGDRVGYEPRLPRTMQEPQISGFPRRSARNDSLY